MSKWIQIMLSWEGLSFAVWVLVGSDELLKKYPALCRKGWSRNQRNVQKIKEPLPPTFLVSLLWAISMTCEHQANQRTWVGAAMIWLWFVPYRNVTDWFSSPSSTILRCNWNFRRWGLSDKLDCANYSFQRNPDSYPFPSLLPAPCEVKNLVPYIWLPSWQVQEAKRTQEKPQELWAEKTFLLQIVLWGSLGTAMRSQHCRAPADVIGASASCHGKNVAKEATQQRGCGHSTGPGLLAHRAMAFGCRLTSRRGSFLGCFTHSFL